MNKEQSRIFLLAIAKEIKRSYECPVILITYKDYANGIYSTLISMHNALIQLAQTHSITEVVNTFHLQWFQAVQDVENLQRAKNIPRKSVFKSLDYTMGCIGNRHKHFQEYINNLNVPLTPTERELMQDEINAILDMQEINGYAVLEKQKNLANSADKDEFRMIIVDEIKELLNWIDRLYDYLALQLCKLLELPQLAEQLNKGLQEVIGEIAFQFLDSDATKVLKSAALCGEKIGHTPNISEDYCISSKDNYFIKISKQIEVLKARIGRLKNEKPSALALKHKLIFLEDELESLDNIQLTLSLLKKQNCVRHENADNDREEECFHIFNHLLPRVVRGRLVEKLVQLWQNAIDNCNAQSIISVIRIKSNEVFYDDQESFTVDENGKKLYKKSSDNQTYQLDEMNNLVPLNDDEYHVYFYDEYGRYYLSKNGERKYKAHQNASEYMLHKTGIMFKMSEIINRVEYRYDRYFYDENFMKIYCDPVNVVIRPDDPMVTENSFYLKETVGDALKECMTEIVMVLSQDPVKYLADRLKRYHFDLKLKKEQQLKQQNLLVEYNLDYNANCLNSTHRNTLT